MRYKKISIMGIIKSAYNYFFYKLYRSFEGAPSRWLSEWKASLSMDILIVFVLISLSGYYTIFTKKELIPDNYYKLVIWIVGLLIASINYFIFNHRNSWQSIVAKFDRLPNKMNKRGTLVVWSIVLLILLNLIFMYYLLSQIDWKNVGS